LLHDSSEQTSAAERESDPPAVPPTKGKATGNGATATEEHAAASSNGQCSTVPEDLVRFIGAIFRRNDHIVIRPIESWVDNGKKQNHILFKKVKHLRASSLADPVIWNMLARIAAADRANIYFGVCPREGPNGQYDLAWQIRSVRALWSDLDSCTVEEALERCHKTYLPLPSIVVSSGHGVHLYWILAEPYLIDPARPPAVLTEWVDRGEGQRKAVRKYIEPKKGQRVYLYLPDRKTGGDSKTPNPECEWGDLSPTAMHVQDVLGGIASKIGGDHTQDLSRLLRLPATLNRKNERNGVEPAPCQLVECHPERRYSFSDFERFAERSPDRQRREAVVKIRLPTIRKLRATNKTDRLNDLINACAVADVGERSERDWALLCWAIENGVDPTFLWGQLQAIGKFAEKGEPYFARSWKQAQLHTRVKIYDRMQRKAAARSQKTTGNGSAASDAPFSVNGDGGNSQPDTPETADCDDAELSELYDETYDETDDDPHRLARTFLRRYRADGRHTLCHWRDEFLQWDGRSYQVIPDGDVTSRLTRHIRHEFEKAYLRKKNEQGSDGDGDDGKKKQQVTVQAVTTRLVANVLQALKSQATLPSDVEPPSWLTDGPPWPPAEALVCRNAILHLPSLVANRPAATTGQTPKLFTRNALDYDFRPDAPAPDNWLSFLAKVWPNDQESINALQEWLGYCLLPDTSQQKILLLIGPKRSGKGTISRVLTGVVGLGNVCTPTLASLSTAFGLWPLLGKTLAIISDARLSGRTDAAVVIERLLSISGEDMQTIDRKYKSAIIAQLPVRFMVMTNELPRLLDGSGALAGRFVVLRMVHSWFGKEDRGMRGRLLSELPSILLWAIAGWQRLQARGRFLQPQSAAVVIEDLERLSAEITPFLEEECYLGPQHEGTSDRLYARWRSWCERNGLKPTGKPIFGRSLHAAVPGLGSRQSRSGEGRTRLYIGIGLRPSPDEEA
jgi:putative DNA primase/helicase